MLPDWWTQPTLPCASLCLHPQEWSSGLVSSPAWSSCSSMCWWFEGAGARWWQSAAIAAPQAAPAMGYLKCMLEEEGENITITRPTSMLHTEYCNFFQLQIRTHRNASISHQVLFLPQTAQHFWHLRVAIAGIQGLVFQAQSPVY